MPTHGDVSIIGVASEESDPLTVVATRSVIGHRSSVIGHRSSVISGQWSVVVVVFVFGWLEWRDFGSVGTVGADHAVFVDP